MFSFKRHGAIRFLRIGRLNVQWSVARKQSVRDFVDMAKRVKAIVK